MKTNRRQVAICRILLAFSCLAWMLFLFLRSAENAEQSSARSEALTEKMVEMAVGHNSSLTGEEKKTWEGVLEPILRNAAHIGGYGILGALYYLFAETFSLSPLLKGALSFAGAVLYAFSDELHQRSVPGRSMEWSDLVRDSCGAAAAVLFLMFVFFLFRRARSRKNR